MKLGIIIAAGALALGTSAFAQLAAPPGGWAQDRNSYATASGESWTYGALYDADFAGPGKGAFINPSSTYGQDGFTVTADVEMWMSMYTAATNIYFHIGGDLGDNPSLTQTVNGWLSSNNGQYIFVTKPSGQVSEGDIQLLKFKHDVRDRTDPSFGGPDIPVVWTATDSTGTIPLTYSDKGNGGQLTGMTWLLNGGDTGYHWFKINCTITPQRYQKDGHYEMDPLLVATPLL